jgi:hypothetical protein
MMWASDDISHVTPIIDSATERMEKDEEHTLISACNTVIESYQEQIRAVATRRYLARLGWDMKTFLKDGAKKLTPEVFESLMNKISGVELRSQFLVCGYDPKRRPHLFSVSDPGDAHFHDNVGFSAIGSGAYSAESALFFFNIQKSAPLYYALYAVCVAKFMAETATDVGKQTSVIFLRRDGQAGIIWPDGVEKIRDLWKKAKSNLIPSGGGEVVRKVVEESSKRIQEIEKQQEK